MDPVADFFAKNILIVYFFYGLSFFCMGLVVWLESNRTSEFRISRVIGPLAGFGIIHGLHEWFEMFKVLSQSQAANIPRWLLLDAIRIPHLVVSFLLLLIFGVRLLYATSINGDDEKKLAYLSAGGLLGLWTASVFITGQVYDLHGSDWADAMDVLARYILGIPGSLLAAWAIILEQRTFKRRGMAGFGHDLRWAAWALIMYGIIGQAFPKESFLFPSNIINDRLFLETFGIPIQFFRASEAAIMAVFVIRALRAFEVERQQRLAHAHEARMAAQQAALETQRRAQLETEELNRELMEREEMLGQLLHQVVSAQEHERRRIARELHDGTGQILTGLGLGLAAARESIHADPGLAIAQLAELKQLNSQALQELHNVISDLRPSLLDDLGLVAAFKAQAREFENRTGVETAFEVDGHRRRVLPEIETIAYRIAQEALTNVAKHAKANRVTISLQFQPNCLTLIVTDDGQGFEPLKATQADDGQRRAWGLLGIQERVALVNGTCDIVSQPGAGTTIRATIPIIKENGYK